MSDDQQGPTEHARRTDWFGEGGCEFPTCLSPDHWPTDAELEATKREHDPEGCAPNRCCDFHRHIADGCCHCDLLGGRDE